MRARTIATAAAIALSVMVVDVSWAAAYSTKDACEESAYRGNNVYYNLGTSSVWDTPKANWGNATPRQVITSAFAVWTLAKNRNGTPLARVSSQPQTGAREVKVIFTSTPGGAFFRLGAFVKCGDPLINRIELAEILLGTGYDAQELYETASHEMGHALGLHHSGLEDSLRTSDTESMMSTGHEAPLGYNLDDAAALSHHWAAGSGRTFTANYGFENQLDFYSASGAQPVWATSGTYEGAYHATVVPNSTSDNLNQSVAVTHATGTYVRPSVQYVTPGATAGVVRLQLFARDTTYVYDASQENVNLFFPLRTRDMNIRLKGAFEYQWYLALDEPSLPLSNSWRSGTTPYRFYIPPVADPYATDAGTVDLRLRLFSSASIAGGYVHVHYDNVRVQEV
ncbi:MAG TPA: hypothetical protein VF519_00980 [Mycobacteriales bacterium]|jgi:hypothetical protein